MSLIFSVIFTILAKCGVGWTQQYCSTECLYEIIDSDSDTKDRCGKVGVPALSINMGETGGAAFSRSRLSISNCDCMCSK